MEDYPLVSIIILNHNGYSTLGDLFFKNVESVLGTNYPRFEVVYVDNNSTDGSVKALVQRYSGIERFKLVRLKRNLGYAAGNNMGVKHASRESKYVVFLNNDTIVDRNWLIELVKVLESDPSIAAAQSLLLTIDGKRVDGAGDLIDVYGYPMIGHHGELYRGQFKSIREIFSARGAAMIVRRNLFEKAGGFDEDFFAVYEDVDLGWRLRLMGYRIVLVLASIVYHLGGGTIKKSGRFRDIAAAPSKNLPALIIKNYDTSNMLKYLPFPYLVYLLSLVRSMFFARDNVVPTVKAMLTSFTMIRKAMAKRPFVQSLRRVSDDAIKALMIKRSIFICLFALGLRWRISYRHLSWEDFYQAQIKECNLSAEHSQRGLMEP